jgi:hypothetical protein
MAPEKKYPNSGATSLMSKAISISTMSLEMISQRYRLIRLPSLPAPR